MRKQAVRDRMKADPMRSQPCSGLRWQIVMMLRWPVLVECKGGTWYLREGLKVDVKNQHKRAGFRGLD